MLRIDLLSRISEGSKYWVKVIPLYSGSVNKIYVFSTLIRVLLNLCGRNNPIIGFRPAWKLLSRRLCFARVSSSRSHRAKSGPLQPGSSNAYAVISSAFFAIKKRAFYCREDSTIMFLLVAFAFRNSPLIGLVFLRWSTTELNNASNVFFILHIVDVATPSIFV